MTRPVILPFLMLLIISGCDMKSSEQKQVPTAVDSTYNDTLEGNEAEALHIFTSHRKLWLQVPEKIDSLQTIRSSDDFNGFTDEEVSKFLAFYVVVMDKLNNIIWADEETEKYNTLAWPADSLHDPLAVKFENGVRKRGFIVASSEGMIYLERDTKLLESIFNGATTPEMTEFLNMYYKEINHPFALDGAIAISIIDLVDRLLYWEDFISQHPEFIMKESVIDQYNLYLNVLLQGMNNTPAFDYNTKKLDDDFRNGYNYLLQEYPQSSTARVISEFLRHLKDNDYKKTDSVNIFIEKVIEN